MEFSAPGVQSRDRSWKKNYFILRGTALSVYKFDPHKHPLRDPKEVQSVVVPIVTEDDSEEYLHVHIPGERRPSLPITTSPVTAQSARRGSDVSITGAGGRRPTITGSPLAGNDARRNSSSMAANDGRLASISSTISGAPTSASSSDSKDPALFPAPGASPRRGTVSSTTSSHSSANQGTSLASHFQQNHLIKQYSLQNAESGLAADYVKKRNVVRVRSEGEQFLLQTENAREVVDWIEVSLLQPDLT